MKAFTRVGPGLYRHSAGSYYWRPSIDGTATWRVLKATNKRDAAKELVTLKAKVARAAVGLDVSPFSPVQDGTVAAVLKFYVDSGCPKRKENSTRAGKQLDEEKRRANNLARILGSKKAVQLAAEDCDDYHAARKKEIRATGKGDGDRAIDLELSCLSCALRWARRKSRTTGIRTNPLVERPRYRDSAKVVHCRDLQPRDGDELHRLARYLFDTRESEVLGWELLFQSMAGLRTSELLQLRMDATNPDHAGFVQNSLLFFPRSTTHKGVAGFVQVHEALAACMAAHRCWHGERSAGSPWFFPGARDPQQHVDTCSLQHALKRACKTLKLPLRTPHGLRSYYVNVLRSEGVIDSEIALRIGHKTGGKLITEVYGEYRHEKITWLPVDPKTTPAWTRWTAQVGVVLPFPAVAG